MTGLGMIADEVLQIEHVQARHFVFADVAGFAAHLLVAAGAERLVAGAGEDDDADIEVFAGVDEGVDHLGDGLGAEGVAHVGPVDGDAGDAVGRLFVHDVFVTSGLLPVCAQRTTSSGAATAAM